MGWTVDKLWSESQQGQEIYLACETSSPVLGHSQGPFQRVPEFPTHEVKRRARETDHASPSNAMSDKEWSYSSTPPYVFTMYTKGYFPQSTQ